MKIYLATNFFENHQGQALTKKHSFCRLLSYIYFIKSHNILKLKEYIITGENKLNKL